MAGILHMLNAPIGGSSGLAVFVDTANIVVSDMLLANGWDGVSVVNPVVTIGAGARVYSTNTLLPAFSSGTLPMGSSLTIINYGALLGRGGNGGKGGDLIPGGGIGSGTGGNGGAGGTALKTSVPTTVTNYGAIAGGGGGGGGGAYVGSGGGGGAGGSLGGAAGTSFSGNYSAIKGANGTLEQAGMGGYLYNKGGNGGFYGQKGSNGVQGGAGDPAGVGGAAGAAVEGNSLVTWAVTGTIYGALVP